MNVREIVAAEVTPELVQEIAVREAAILVRQVIHQHVEEVVRELIRAQRAGIEWAVYEMFTPKQECSNGNVETVRD
jgi:hypothetical protein